MLKFLFGRQQSRKNWRPADEDWSRDPLAHPDIAAMSARALADLPLVPPPSDGHDYEAVSRKSPRSGEAMGRNRAAK